MFVKTVFTTILLTSSVLAAPVLKRGNHEPFDAPSKRGDPAPEPVYTTAISPLPPSCDTPDLECVPDPPEAASSPPVYSPPPYQGYDYEQYQTTVQYEPPMPSYGSGYQQWQGYNDCVSQCTARYGALQPSQYAPPEPYAPPPEQYAPPPAQYTSPPAQYTPPSYEPPASYQPNMHYVLVAPVDGVTRYVPNAVNASIGDTVRFVWKGTKDHSVTMGTQLNVCKKNAGADSFDSGLLSGKDGEKTFDVTVKSDQPVYFFCSKGDHCQKGMWGIINPKNSWSGNNTVGAQMSTWAAINPNIDAAWSMLQNSTNSTEATVAALKWGDSMDASEIPEDQLLNFAANTLLTKSVIAANAGVQSGRSQDLVIPEDISNILAQVNASPGNATSTPDAENMPVPSSAYTSGSVRAVGTAGLAVAIFAAPAMAVLL